MVKHETPTRTISVSVLEFMCLFSSAQNHSASRIISNPCKGSNCLGCTVQSAQQNKITVRWRESLFVLNFPLLITQAKVRIQKSWNIISFSGLQHKYWLGPSLRWAQAEEGFCSAMPGKVAGKLEWLHGCSWGQTIIWWAQTIIRWAKRRIGILCFFSSRVRSNCALRVLLRCSWVVFKRSSILSSIWEEKQNRFCDDKDIKVNIPTVAISPWKLGARMFWIVLYLMRC